MKKIRAILVAFAMMVAVGAALLTHARSLDVVRMKDGDNPCVTENKPADCTLTSGGQICQVGTKVFYQHPDLCLNEWRRPTP